uniref:Uncharacterized protein n=1 Tax=Glossina palpalis gambiensis TaxID=67801 RepID=A0A1B0BHB8_9MUSC
MNVQFHSIAVDDLEALSNTINNKLSWILQLRGPHSSSRQILLSRLACKNRFSFSLAIQFRNSIIKLLAPAGFSTLLSNGSSILGKLAAEGICLRLNVSKTNAIMELLVTRTRIGKLAKVTQGCLSDFNAITSLARSSCVTIAKAASGNNSNWACVCVLQTSSANSCKRPPFIITKCRTLRELASLIPILAPNRISKCTVFQPERDAAKSNGDLCSLSSALTDDCIKCQMFPSVTQDGIEIIATILFLAEIDYISLSRLTNKLTNNSDFACISEVCATLVHWKDFNCETEYYFYFLIKRTLRIAVRTIMVYTMPPCDKGVVHNKLVEAQVSNRKERSHFPFTAAGIVNIQQQQQQQQQQQDLTSILKTELITTPIMNKL